MDINEAAEAPKRSQIGGETIEEHSLPDRIAYERYKKQQESAADVNSGRSVVRRTRLFHPRP